jgi:predicted metal-dependent phosphoesterase TrpH
MPFADLHTHSLVSDGVLDPAQIIEQAYKTDSLHAISITDHDALDAAHSIVQTGLSQGLDFIPGVEISTRFGIRDVHMLGYFIDIDNQSLNEYFADNRRRRAQRACEMADLLKSDGYPISADDLIESGESVNRLLLTRMLVKRNCARDADDAFSRLVGRQSKYYIDFEYPDAIEAIRLIREANGYAFIAHPAQYHVVDLIQTFAHEGLTGLEAYHSMQSAKQSADLILLAQDLDLAVSGGSDWHGDDTHGARLGGAGLDESEYRAFLTACSHR